MAGLGTLADYAEVFGALVVVGGLAFAAVQLHLARRARRDRTTVEALRVWQTPDLIRAHDTVWSLPDGIAAAELRARGRDAEQAAHIVGHIAEALGVMVFHRVATLAIVQDIMGDALRVDWRKLSAWVATLREEQGRATVYEWFEWLVGQLAAHAPAYKKAGAQVAFRSWRP